MDVKAKIEEVVNKVRNDPNFAQNFKADPMTAVKSIIGQDAPGDLVQQVVTGAQGMLAGNQAGDMLGGIKKMF